MLSVEVRLEIHVHPPVVGRNGQECGDEDIEESEA
jgi:hypothetical protein